jgi:hypothetical protein
MDTRSGYVYGLAEASRDHEELQNAWKTDDEIDRTRRDVEGKAFAALVGDLQKTWDGVVKEYAVPARVSSGGGASRRRSIRRSRSLRTGKPKISVRQFCAGLTVRRAYALLASVRSSGAGRRVAHARVGRIGPTQRRRGRTCSFRAVILVPSFSHQIIDPWKPRTPPAAGCAHCRAIRPSTRRSGGRRRGVAGRDDQRRRRRIR